MGSDTFFGLMKTSLPWCPLFWRDITFGWMASAKLSSLILALRGGEPARLDWPGMVEAPLLFAFPRTNPALQDRKSTRLNSSHLVISYAVFSLKRKNNNNLID